MNRRQWVVIIAACHIVGAVIVVLDAWAIGRAANR